MNNQKLELNWIGKYKKMNLEPRILIEDSRYSYGDVNTENVLIHGDNLLALKALENQYTNKIKCIYIDPPYNTGSAFEYYDDNLEHSIWLNLMYARLKVLRNLLNDNGVILVHIDDNEQAYLKVIMDEIFGRNNFVNSIAIKSSTASGLKTAHRDKTIIKTKDYILVYKKNTLKINPQYKESEEWDTHFNYYFDKKNNKVLSLHDVVCQSGIYPQNVSGNKFSLKNKEFYDFVSKNADKIFQTGKSMPEDIRKQSLLPENKDVPISYNEDGDNVQYAYNGRRMSFLNQSIHYIANKGQEGIAKLVCDFWDDIDFNNSQNEGGVSFPASKKPEILLYRIINMFTEEGDYVLDSFLGSGTTAAVAQKTNRKWIGIELGNHCFSHCIPRINSVIDGKDNRGITKLVNWKGGGGYKFYELAPSLLVKDKFNNWIISEEYNGNMLVQAICKQEKFDYIEKQEDYWKQGKSSENDYIYVTTNYVSLEYLRSIEEEMKDDESLLICCKSYQEECETANDRITVKKIPQAILKNCEYGVDDYSLNVNEVLNMGEIEDEE